MEEIARGAEAVIFEKDNTIIKSRFKKNYRLADLDTELRNQRTKREANLLRKLTIPHPKLLSTDDKETIIMEKIPGCKVKEALDEEPILARKIGEIVANMHNQNIVHGDLTTSNMILKDDQSIVFIDFGLSFQSHKVEDKAVDIHLFKQALNSKHHKVYDKAFSEFLAGYKGAEKFDEIIGRLEEVELRGRYRKG